MEDEKNTIVGHLNELRSHIIKSLIALFVCAIATYNYLDLILPFMTKPVGKLIFIAPQEAFIAKLKIAFLGGLILSSPFMLYQTWKFISAGLMPQEKKYVTIFGPFSFILFVAGFAFGYFIIVPLAAKFLLGFANDVLRPMISVNNYVSFVTSLCFAFALVFQLPLVLLFLTKIRIVTPSMLAKRRREAIVLVFIAAAILTPPDVITQVLMAMPLIVLYEIGIILSKIAYRPNG